MNRTDQDLLSGEGVVYRSGLHGAVCLAPTFFLAVVAAVAVVLGVNADALREAGLSPGWAVSAVLGLGGLWGGVWLLPKVEAVEVEQGALGRLLGYGTVIISGTGGTHELFPAVASPWEFRRQVQQQTTAVQR